MFRGECDNCGSDVSSESIFCQSCYETKEHELENAEEEIDNLNNKISDLEAEIVRLNLLLQGRG